MLLTTLAAYYLGVEPGSGVAAAGPYAGRHGARRRRRVGPQPGVGALHRRADAAHADPAAPRRPAAAAATRGCSAWRSRRSVSPSWRSRQPADQRPSALLSLVSYVLFYTPLRSARSLSTIVGAVPGALPAVIGWTAATNTLSIEGWVLFAIVFMWQMPHFLAIAWMYRHDYADAGSDCCRSSNPMADHGTAGRAL